jgi:hypothetical protein
MPMHNLYAPNAGFAQGLLPNCRFIVLTGNFANPRGERERLQKIKLMSIISL